MPRYRENPLITPFSMLCPGISQNTKHHHLTLYKGQVWSEKSYLELCDQNVLNIAHTHNHTEPLHPGDMIFGSHFSVPPVPGYGFKLDDTQIPWDSEILQSFAELTHITNITLHSFDTHEDSLEDVTYQISVGSWVCSGAYYKEQCFPPYRYYPNYIWTKEGLKIQIKNIRFLTLFSLFPYFDPTSPSFHHEDPG